jgi:hypothetical protein
VENSSVVNPMKLYGETKFIPGQITRFGQEESGLTESNIKKHSKEMEVSLYVLDVGIIKRLS